MFLENPIKPEYASLFNDVELHRDNMYALVREILENNISKYPVFVAYTKTVDLGRPFIRSETHGTQWNINISILEDLVNKGVIEVEKASKFIKNYKDPEQYFCFIAIFRNRQEVIFFPRSKHGLN